MTDRSVIVNIVPEANPHITVTGNRNWKRPNNRPASRADTIRLISYTSVATGQASARAWILLRREAEAFEKIQ